ncbi:MAG: hypothetical protein ABJB40_01625 [Acidobacteriota bacterium]
MSESPLSDPFFCDELIGDNRNRAALQARQSCQIGSRNRLAGPDQIQQNAPVNVPGGFARSNIKTGQIYFPHIGTIDGKVFDFVRDVNNIVDITLRQVYFEQFLLFWLLSPFSRRKTPLIKFEEVDLSQEMT